MNLKTMLLSLAMVFFFVGCSTSSPSVPNAAMKASNLPKDKVGAVLYGVDGDKEKEFMAVLDAMKAKGYKLSDPHERINDAYVKKYGSTKLDNLGFFSTTKDAAVMDIMISNPKVGGFSPFNFHVYKKKSENITWYGHVKPEVMADIVGLTEPVARKAFVDSFADLDALANSMMKPTHTKELKYAQLPKYTMMEFEIPFAVSDDAIEDFQGKFESVFEKNGYIIAGFKNFKDVYDDEKFAYEAYWVYSLCHFPFSNGIFNDIPEAGIFAPCSIYMYVDKGGKVLKVGMPTLANWVEVSNIQDAKMVESIDKLDNEIINIFVKELNAKLVGR